MVMQSEIKILVSSGMGTNSGISENMRRGCLIDRGDAGMLLMHNFEDEKAD
jgi:hypothetical protein